MENELYSSLKPVSNIEHLAIIQEMLPADITDIAGSSKKGLVQIWKEKNDFVCPGLTKEHIIAICFETAYPIPSKAQEFGKICHDFIVSVFGNDNLLYGGLWQSKTDANVLFVIYPLKGRMLDARPWLNERLDGISDDLLSKFRQFISGFHAELNTINSEVQYSSDTTSPDIKEESSGAGNVMDAESSDFSSIEQFIDSEEIYHAKSINGDILPDINIAEADKIFSEIMKHVLEGESGSRYEEILESSEEDQLQFLHGIRDYINKSYEKLSGNDRKYMIIRTYNALFKHHILESLINDNNISAIRVISPSKIRVQSHGKWLTADLKFFDPDDYNRFLHILSLNAGINIKDGRYHEFTKSSLRYTIMPCLNRATTYNCLIIKKVKSVKSSMEKFVQDAVLGKTAAEYLIKSIRERKNIIIAGRYGSGKTSLLNSLIEYIPYSFSCIILQKEDELYSEAHPDMLTKKVEDNYILKDELKEIERIGYDYMIIGEIEKKEVPEYLHASDGNASLCTYCCANKEGLLNALYNNIKSDDFISKNRPMETTEKQNIIVFMDSFKVSEIIQITGIDNINKKLMFNTVYHR